MNTSTHLVNLKTVLENIQTNVGTVDFTDLETNAELIADSSAITSASTQTLASCVDIINGHLEVDTNAINGVMMAVNSGNNNDGTKRVTIANDDTLKGPIHTTGTLTDINTPGTTKCFVMGGAQLDGKFAPITLSNTGYIQSDITKINGNTIDTSSGNLSAGTIRTGSATNDTNLLYIRTQNVVMGGAANGACCTRSNVNQCPFGVGFSRYDDGAYNAFIATGAGNIADDPTYVIPGGTEQYGYAVPRITIASDDVNLSAIKTKLDQIYTILNDVWDSAGHKLKVNTA